MLCEILSILTQVYFNFVPASAQPETVFSGCVHPDRQDYLHTKQHKEEQPHLQERELIWDNCAGKGFLTNFRT